MNENICCPHCYCKLTLDEYYIHIYLCSKCENNLSNI